MKKNICVLLAIAIFAALCLTGCGSESKLSDTEAKPAATEVPKVEAAPAEEAKTEVSAAEEKTEETRAEAPAAEEKTEETRAEAPAGETKSEATKTEVKAEKPHYTVTAVDEEGNPVVGVQVQVCSDTNCLAKKTGDEGTCKFNLDPGEYEAHVLKVPEGYELEGDAEFKTSAEVTDITLTFKKAA